MSAIEKPASVRYATQDDEAALYALLVELHRHNGAGWGIPYSPVTVAARIETATRHDVRTRTNPADHRHGIIGVIDGPSGIIASVGLFDEPPTWFADGTDVRALVEIWLYVRPIARQKARHFINLFKFSIFVHEAMKADLRKMGNTLPFPLLTGFQHQGDDYERMEQLWRRYSGGKKVGSLYIRE